MEVTEHQPLMRLLFLLCNKLLQKDKLCTIICPIGTRVVLEELLASRNIDLRVNANLPQANDELEEVLHLELTVFLQSPPLPRNRTLNSAVELCLVIGSKIKTVLLDNRRIRKISTSLADIIHLACENLVSDERRQARETPARNLLHLEEHEKVARIINTVDNRSRSQKPARKSMNLRAHLPALVLVSEPVRLIEDGTTPDAILKLLRKEKSGSGDQLFVVAQIEAITSSILLLESTHSLPAAIGLSSPLDAETSLLCLLFPL